MRYKWSRVWFWKAGDFVPDNPKHPKSPSFTMETRVLMLVGLPSSFKNYHFVDPQATGGRFCSRHDVGARLSAEQFCAR